MKKISSKERLEILENFMQRQHFLRHVACDEKKVYKMLLLADAYVEAQAKHGPDGKPLDAKQIQERTTEALLNMKELP